jgi:hypothetical protein
LRVIGWGGDGPAGEGAEVLGKLDVVRDEAADIGRW